MKVDLSNLNPFTKCYFDEEKPEEGWIELRTLTIAKIKEIEEKSTSEKKTFKRGQVLTEKKVNHNLKDKMTWGYCIGDWSRMLDANDNDVPNDTKHKVLLMNNSPTVASFVADKLEELGDQEEQEAEAEEKN
jgi:hypothetical protein